jgi:hypothetical protein
MMTERFFESEFVPNESGQPKDGQADQPIDRPGQLRAILPIWEDFEDEEMDPPLLEANPLDPKIAQIADSILDDLLASDNAKAPDETWFS